MKIKTVRERGIGLSKAFESVGIPSHIMDRNLQSGRLTQEEEYKIMRHLKANTIGEATDALITGRETFKGTSSAELTKKGWISKGDIRVAKRFIRFKN